MLSLPHNSTPLFASDAEWAYVRKQYQDIQVNNRAPLLYKWSRKKHIALHSSFLLIHNREGRAFLVHIIAEHWLGVGENSRTQLVQDFHGRLYALKMRSTMLVNQDEADALNACKQLYASVVLERENSAKVYLLMSLKKGVTLSQYLRLVDEEALDPSDYDTLAYLIITAVKALHEQKFVHGDLSPDHMLIFQHSSGKLTLSLIGFGQTKPLSVENQERELEQLQTLLFTYIWRDDAVSGQLCGLEKDKLFAPSVLKYLSTGRTTPISDWETRFQPFHYYTRILLSDIKTRHLQTMVQRLEGLMTKKKFVPIQDDYVKEYVLLSYPESRRSFHEGDQIQAFLKNGPMVNASSYIVGTYGNKSLIELVTAPNVSVAGDVPQLKAEIINHLVGIIKSIHDIQALRDFWIQLKNEEHERPILTYQQRYLSFGVPHSWSKVMDCFQIQALSLYRVARNQDPLRTIDKSPYLEILMVKQASFFNTLNQHLQTFQQLVAEQPTPEIQKSSTANQAAT